MPKTTNIQEIDNKRTEPFSCKLPALLLRKMKYIAFKDETKQTDIVINSVDDFIAKWEKKNGEIKL